MKSSKYELKPSYYRHGHNKPENEFGFFYTFRCKASGYIETRKNLFDGWDDYFMAQHYGHDTRLLDWSLSLATATFFAVNSYNKRNRNPPCLWILNASALNELVLGSEHKAVKTVGKSDMISDAWSIEEIEKKKHNSLPIAIHPSMTNVRINAQLGRFTIHGREKLCIAELIKEKSEQPEKIIQKVLIDPESVEGIKKDLELMGIYEVTLFPEIDYVAKFIEENY